MIALLYSFAAARLATSDGVYSSILLFPSSFSPYSAIASSLLPSGCNQYVAVIISGGPSLTCHTMAEAHELFSVTTRRWLYNEEQRESARDVFLRPTE